MQSHPYVCLTCKQPLQRQTKEYVCPKCGNKYRVFAGIPNFKSGEIYPGEESVLERLSEQYDKLDFFELLEYADNQPEKNILPWELRRNLRFKNKSDEERKKWLEIYSQKVIIESGEIQMHVTQTLIQHSDIKVKNNICLDIGCGRGPWAVAASRKFKHIFALDMDMASVIIAKKYCEAKGINNITFLSASSSAMPFPNNYFDLINCQAVLEHVDNQFKSLQEIQRLLAEEGCFTGDSVNRFNLVTPEPHIDLRLIGFLPKSWAHKVSLALKNFPYDDIKPLSYSQLDDMLEQTFGENSYEIVPFVEVPQQKCLTQSISKRMPETFLKQFNHTHSIVATKESLA